ncbi:MAG: acyl-carrier-protein S-malonyltransferase, partial [Halothiobacillaceae bacterium]
MALGFVFPGQGSQTVGMSHDLAQHYPIVRQTYNEAAEVLGYDLWSLVEEGPEAVLNQTDKTQPAMLAAAVAVWRVWREQMLPLPTVMAGHSLGEYTALSCAGALSFADAIKLVAARGRFMQEAVPSDQGAMAAILGLEDKQVIELCAYAANGEVLAAVNFNSPGQVVVAGDKAAVNRLVAAANAAGAKRALLLAVSVPSHCALMRPAAEKLAELLTTITINVGSIP